MRTLGTLAIVACLVVWHATAVPMDMSPKKNLTELDLHTEDDESSEEVCVNVCRVGTDCTSLLCPYCAGSHCTQLQCGALGPCLGPEGCGNGTCPVCWESECAPVQPAACNTVSCTESHHCKRKTSGLCSYCVSGFCSNTNCGGPCSSVGDCPTATCSHCVDNTCQATG